MVALTDTNSVSFKLKNSSEVSVNFSFDVQFYLYLPGRLSENYLE